MGVRPVNVLSLCSGVGGLDLGVRLACRSARTVCYVERETFCCEVLATRMEDGSLDEAPVWSDLQTFDGRPWRGVVDLVVAGIPCQGNSMAGKRKLEEDPRNLWPATRQVLRAVGPRYFFLENVPGLLVPGSEKRLPAPVCRILGELAEGGWDAEWLCVAASDLGATHRRERVFLLAIRDGTRRQKTERRNQHSKRKPSNKSGVVARRQRGGDERRGRSGDVGGSQGEEQGQTHKRQRHGNAADDSIPTVGDGKQQVLGRQSDAQERKKIGRTAADRTGSVVDQSAGVGREQRQRRGQQEKAQAREEPRPENTGKPVGKPQQHGLEGVNCPRRWPGTVDRPDGDWPPAPGDVAGWQRVIADFPYFAPALEPGVRVLADGDAVWLVDESRRQQLSALGNAVVPVQAAAALTILARRLGVAENLGVMKP